jgi:hypothetical protein
MGKWQKISIRKIQTIREKQKRRSELMSFHEKMAYFTTARFDIGSGDSDDDDGDASIA